MSSKVKDIDIKSRTYYFFNDFINIKNFDQHDIKVDGKSYKVTLIYYVGYVIIKHSKYVKIYSVNPLHLIFRNVNEYFKEINKIKHLMLVCTNKSKEKRKKI